MLTYGKQGEMWERFCTWDNFDIAQKRSRLHKSSKSYIIRFEADRDKNLEAVRQLGITGQYKISSKDYRRKIIYEPKEREIFMLNYAPHRIMQHAVINVLMPYYMRMFDYDSYSCIVGRGQVSASKRTMRMVHRYKWCLETDVRHCFPSINLDILSRMHHDKFNDKKFLEINDVMIYSMADINVPSEEYVVYDNRGKAFLCRKEYKNCPIGNYSSQWYMNYYMTAADLFCQHTLRIPHVRFCDNCNMYSNNLDEIKRAKDLFPEFMHKHLGMSLSKCNIRRCQDGVEFVGYRHFPNGKLLVRKSTVKKQKRFLKKLPEQYELGLITLDTFRSSIDSVLGWWEHAQTHNLIKSTGIIEMRDKYVKEAKCA